MTQSAGSDAAKADGASRGGGAQRHTGRSGRFGRFVDAFGMVLVLIVVTIALAGLLGGSAWGRPIVVVAMAITLQVGLAASRAGRRRRRIATIASALLVVVAVAGAVAGSEHVAVVAISLMTVLLAVLLPLAILRDLAEKTWIDVKTIAGAMCIYLLLGLFFATLYMTVDVLSPAGFFAQDVPNDAFDFIYFSYITMATVGFGDLTPAGNTARMLTVLEALIGQIYLVTVVALLVGNIGRQRHWRRRAPSGEDVANGNGGPEE